MIEVKENTLTSFLYTIREKAMETQEKYLYSWTKEIEPIDFLSVFEDVDQLKKNRMFWSNSDRGFQIIGIGNIVELVSNQDSFRQTQEQWDAILDQAVIHNPYHVKGTGITALGGMAFDPRRKKSELWHQYPTGKLTIPEYMLIFSENRFFITMNGYIDQTDIVHDVVERNRAVQETLFHSHHRPNIVSPKIIKKSPVKSTEWKAIVQKAVEEIKQNRARKIVLAREIRVTLDKTANISNMLRKLLATQKNSYVFALEQDESCFIGASPERLVQIDGDQLLSTCLAGTAPRGETEEVDERIARDLLEDEKNREEHEYVVQMIRENIECYCEDIHIPQTPVIYPLRNLQHLYTPVTATLKDNYTVFDLIKNLHPTPALGGVPREKAMQFIREEEFMDRGWYGAPVGWVDSNHNSEFAVAIRSGLVQNNEVSLFAGCGVMRDSDPEKEFEETNVKFSPMLDVLEDHHGA